MVFDLFISYRRQEASAVADWLRTRLKTYRLPAQLEKNKKADPISVYLDETYLRPDEDFWNDNIIPALDNSKYLLVLITSKTFQSLPDGKPNWVQREIEHFSQHHSGGKIMFALVDADFNTALPDELKMRYSNPGLIDLRKATQLVKRTLPDSFLTEQIRSIAADLYDVSSADMPILRREDENRRRRRNIWISLASAAALATVFVSGWLVVDAQRDSVEAQLLAEERGIYSEASRVLTAAEQALDRDSTIALALGMYAADKLSVTDGVSGSTDDQARVLPGLRPFFDRVLNRRPASQVLVVEEREKANEVEVFPSNFYGVEALSFIPSSDYLLVHHRADYSSGPSTDEGRGFAGISTELGHPGHISVWHISSGRRVFSSGDRNYLRTLTIGSRNKSFVALQSNGAIEVFEILTDGSAAATKRIDGSFVGLFVSETDDQLYAWDHQGSIFVINIDEAFSDKLIDLAKPILSASVSEKLVSLAAYHDDDTISLISLSNTENVRQLGSRIEASETGFSTDWERPNIQLHFFAKANTLTAVFDGDSASIEVYDLLETASVYFREERYSDIAVNARAEKFAIVDSSSITQFVVNRSAIDVTIDEESEWAVSDTDLDVGRSQLLLYGPYGEYLLGTNAPILQNVGAKPALVKLYNANEFRDNRIKDVHSALQLSSRDTPILSGAFGDQGDRVALFLTNGKVQIFDIYPEQAVSVSSRSQDYFNSFRHLPFEDKAILSNTDLSASTVLASIKSRYHAALKPNEIQEVETALESQESLIDALEFVWSAPGTIALQPGGTRDELPNLAYGTIPGYMPGRPFSDYDPLENGKLAGLADNVLADPAQGSLSLARHYADAVDNDILLLTGVQIIPLLSAIEKGPPEKRHQAWVAIAFSGSKDVLPKLIELRKAETDTSVRIAADWAIEFLDTFGRGQALDDAAVFRGDWSNRQQILAGPEEITKQLPFDRFSRIPVTPEAANIILDLAQNESLAKPFPLLARASDLISSTSLGRPTQIATDMNFAVYLRDQGLLEEALTITTQLVDRNPEDERFRGQPENLHGFILYRLERYDEAIEYFQKSIEAGRPDGWPERNMAEAYGALGQNQKAKESFEKAIEKANTLFGAIGKRLEAGEISQEQHDTDRAGVVNEFAGFYNDFAWFLVNIENASDEDISRALELSGMSNRLTEFKDPSYIDTLAHAYALSGNFERAVELERQAISLAEATGSNSINEFRAKLDQWEVELEQHSE